jgi:hypothetical protein
MQTVRQVAGDRCVQIVSCVIMWLASIRLARLLRRRLFTFERRRVFALRTREKGPQSHHYDQSRPFLEEVEETEVRWMACKP